MQSDIVERLLSVERGQGHSFSVHGPYDTPVRRVVPYGNMMHEAATEITALRERVAKLEGDRQWRLIESAPMDGTPILGFVWPHVEMCHWGRAAHSFVITNHGLPVSPTHWMPLPDSPPSTDGV